MQEACDATRGGMAAIIGLDKNPTREVCARAGVAFANLNCPGQLVISGEAGKIANAVEMAKAKGAKRAVPLPVAGAYHSPLMAGAGPKLAAELAENEDFFAGDSGHFQRDRPQPTARRPGFPRGWWSRSPRRSAGRNRCDTCWRRGLRDSSSWAPGTALSGFMKRIDKNVQMLNVTDLRVWKPLSKHISI
jgi:[acyl-carrier-protein] S-malonyltransferase